jgi:hypothetical protein
MQNKKKENVIQKIFTKNLFFTYDAEVLEKYGKESVNKNSIINYFKPL